MRYRKTSSENLFARDRYRALALVTMLAGTMAAMIAEPADALIINAQYDASVNSAPAGFTTAFQTALNYFTGAFSDPITINIGVGWGEIAGYSIAPGALGESESYLSGYYSYTQVRNAMVGDARTSADQTALASLPPVDPTGGNRMLMSTSEAKALGLLNYRGTDGFVGFDRTASWTFNSANRAASGAFDLIGVAEHEVSEVLGRVADLGTIGWSLDPLDLFRYSGPNSRALSPGNGQYFSINGGSSNLSTFNSGDGDLGDWAWSDSAPDAYSAAASPGHLLPLSRADTTLLDVLGYDLTGQPNGVAVAGSNRTTGSQRSAQIAEIAEPGTLAVFGAALLGLGFVRHSHRS